MHRKNNKAHSVGDSYKSSFIISPVSETALAEMCTNILYQPSIPMDGMSLRKI